MKVIVLLSVVATVAAVYTDVDETINVDDMIANKETVKSYIDCFLDKGPCTENGSTIKQHIREILSNACQNCDDKLKHFAEEFLLNVMVKMPEEMAQLKAKYDPKGTMLAGLALEVSKY